MRCSGEAIGHSPSPPFQAEQAGGPWQGDYSFYTATLEMKRYWPVFGTRVVAARARAGIADAFGLDQVATAEIRFGSGSGLPGLWAARISSAIPLRVDDEIRTRRACASDVSCLVV